MAARSGCASMATVTLVGLAMIIVLIAVVLIAAIEWLPELWP